MIQPTQYADNAKIIAEKLNIAIYAQKEVFQVGFGKKRYTLENAMKIAMRVKKRNGYATMRMILDGGITGIEYIWQH